MPTCICRPSNSSRRFSANASIGPVCAALPKLPPANQIALIAVLSEYHGNTVTAALSQAAKSDQKDVRLAALKAFEKAGDAASVALLAETAASAPPDEQAAARTSLWGMKGKPVDEAVLALLSKAPERAPSKPSSSKPSASGGIFAGKSVAVKFADAPSGQGPASKPFEGAAERSGRRRTSPPFSTSC